MGVNISTALSAGLQAFRVGAIAVGKRIALNALYGAVIGGAAGEWDAIIADGDPVEGLLNGARGGAVFGGLSAFRSIQGILQIVGIGLGGQATIDAWNDGNIGLAAYRGLFTAVGAFSTKYFRTAAGDLEQPGSMSNAQTREWYKGQLAKIPSQIDQTASWRDKGLQAFLSRRAIHPSFDRLVDKGSLLYRLHLNYTRQPKHCPCHEGKSTPPIPDSARFLTKLNVFLFCLPGECDRWANGPCELKVEG
jgi:hypothetical protein